MEVNRLIVIRPSSPSFLSLVCYIVCNRMETFIYLFIYYLFFIFLPSLSLHWDFCKGKFGSFSPGKARCDIVALPNPQRMLTWSKRSLTCMVIFLHAYAREGLLPVCLFVCLFVCFNPRISWSISPVTGSVAMFVTTVLQTEESSCGILHVGTRVLCNENCVLRSVTRCYLRVTLWDFAATGLLPARYVLEILCKTHTHTHTFTGEFSLLLCAL